MKRFLANLSIRNKLVGIILVPTVLSLGTGFTLVMITSLRQFEEDLIETTGLVAHAAANYSAVALAFDDPTEAASALEPLQGLDYVTEVYLFDLHGAMFAGWKRDGEPDPPTDPAAIQGSRSEIHGGFVHHVRPVVWDGRTYGTIYVLATAEPLERRTREYFVQLAALMATLVLFAVAVAYVLQRFISGPILELARRTQEISDRGDYTLRVDKPGNDEIGVLYDGFNAMLSQIQSRQEELERSNRDLDQFAYVASHDLKAPLRAIVTLAGWLEEDLEDHLSDEGREHLRLLESRVMRMDRLIEGILQYSRVGRLETGVERVDVGAMVRELVEVLAPPAGLRVEVDPGLPTLVTRRLRLEQVLSNLLSNAFKYHHRPDGGHVRIGAERKGRFYEITVADDGPGIAEQHHRKVFQMFQTLQPRDQVESTGLGLSLVTKLVEEEGGEVTLRSAAGAGATFRFTWPAEPRRGDDTTATLESDRSAVRDPE